MVNRINNDQEIIQLVASMFFRAGTDLTNNPTNSGYLRDIQSQLQDLAFRSTDKRLTFLLFMIPLFVSDLHYNIVGDIVGVDIEELNNVRRIVFNELGSALIAIADKLKDNNLDSVSVIYMDLVHLYLFNINMLNGNNRAIN